MMSRIDPTKPIYRRPTTASVRANFAAAKAEIEYLCGYDLPFTVEGSPGASARLAAIILVRPVAFPVDLAGSIFRFSGTVEGDYVLDVQYVRDGFVVESGTVTLHVDGTATGDIVTFDGEVGDEVWVFAPSTPDAGVTSIRAAIKGTAVLP